MAKSLRNDRRFSDDYQYEDPRDNAWSKRDKKAQRREDKRQARFSALNEREAA